MNGLFPFEYITFPLSGAIILQKSVEDQLQRGFPGAGVGGDGSLRLRNEPSKTVPADSSVNNLCFLTYIIEKRFVVY